MRSIIRPQLVYLLTTIIKRFNLPFSVRIDPTHSSTHSHGSHPFLIKSDNDKFIFHLTRKLSCFVAVCRSLQVQFELLSLRCHWSTQTQQECEDISYECVWDMLKNFHNFFLLLSQLCAADVFEASLLLLTEMREYFSSLSWINFREMLIKKTSDDDVVWGGEKCLLCFNLLRL